MVEPTIVPLPIFLRSRRFLIPCSLLALTALICTQVPLLNYLGFEFSTLVAVVASVICGLMTIALSRRHESPIASLRVSFVASAVLLAVPAIVMAGNALVVKNCSLLEGALFYLLIPVPAVVLMISVAFLLSVLKTRFKKTLFVLVYAAVLLHIPVVTFTDVQIFAFNPIVGYFPGITYDEVITIEGRLVMYRISTLALAGLVTILAIRILRRRGRKPIPMLQILMGVTCAVIVAATFLLSNDLGLSSSASSVQSQLKGVIETDHFVITYPATRVDGAKAAQLAALHEFQFERLARELRVIPRKKIYSFLYASAEQKRLLVGAGRTNIAKPWLWQIHVNLDDVERALAHELIHVLAADFGSPILRIGWNPGLIEGLAVAVERVEYDETIHRLARMVQQAGVRMNLADVFTIRGFVQSVPGVSYTTAGSFCRFLIDRYGWRRFKRVYRSGDFQSVYGKSLSRLGEEWAQFLSGYRLTDGHVRKGLYLFKRPSIFAKECARVVAAMNGQTARLLAEGEYGAALSSARASLDRSISVEAILQQAEALFRLGWYDEVVHHSDSFLADTSLAHALLPLMLTKGDALLVSGRAEEARTVYRNVFDAHLSLAFDEALGLRLAGSQEIPADEFFALLRGRDSDSVQLNRIRALVQRHPQHAVPRYLLGRQLQLMEMNEEAVMDLVRAGPFRIPELEHVRMRRIARAYFDLGNYQKAKMYFWLSLNFTTNEAHALQIQEWLDRCDWYERQPAFNESPSD